MAYQYRGCELIPVVSPIPEPANFDADCRQRGRQWLAGHPDADRPRDFWSSFRDDLREGFQRRCGYRAMHLEDGSIDHFLSWDKTRATLPNLAYEWDNFRFITSSLNSSKKNRDDQLLDPFEIEDGWFEVDIPSFILRITSRLPLPLRAKAEFTLRHLKLEGGRRAVALRWEWYEQHRLGELNLAGLWRHAPLVAQAVEEWQSAGRGSLPEVPRPA